MNTFCAAAELKVSLERPDCPQILQTCIPILQSCFPDMKEGTLMHDIQALGTPKCNVVNERVVTLSDDIHRAFVRLTESHELKFHEYPRYTIRGNEFATRHTSMRNSTIWYQPHGSVSLNLVPGVIRQIFSPACDADRVFLAVHRHVPTQWELGDCDPFAAFPDFGASIWSKTTQVDVEVIQSTQRIYGTEFRTWDTDRQVMKPIIEASVITFE